MAHADRQYLFLSKLLLAYCISHTSYAHMLCIKAYLIEEKKEESKTENEKMKSKNEWRKRRVIGNRRMIQS